MQDAKQGFARGIT